MLWKYKIGEGRWKKRFCFCSCLLFGFLHLQAAVTLMRIYRTNNEQHLLLGRNQGETREAEEIRSVSKWLNQKNELAYINPLLKTRCDCREAWNICGHGLYLMRSYSKYPWHFCVWLAHFETQNFFKNPKSSLQCASWAEVKFNLAFECKIDKNQKKCTEGFLKTSGHFFKLGNN